MKSKSLWELEKEGKRTLGELERLAQGRLEEESRRLIKMIAKKEGVDFEELWAIFDQREKYRGYWGSDQLRFSIAEYAPIEYWIDKAAWFVYMAIPNYYVKVNGLGEALALAKQAYEKQPWEYDRVIVSG